ncbi:hypothetical protein IRP63_04365 [Clostridium botulinum]|uniref:RDD family protein n=1 Tax=Clostridium botulinum C/D str. DC5 TaxID=1443128 RepID=A0A0A0IIK0_CLOBO|nr:hypothetical protein [Clostridium botulinum]KEI04045.1 hypothetical protein Z952_07595 [Clostridium botulinum C/D str. BKT75002]KEI10134.1 hypothetical protein Z954_10470 [Clostridium botulinum C/D str. BKT2873]KGM98335.1 hypothetical protein Z956_00080 [Clostridium botulinum D str. CCUG 7971]KGN00082.1 hypothetical protein Z955_05000 [Clostridium botulinum C/D str. DC5]KOC50913.1 hypothetical protein ADU88_01120 [Clostridium botulinum]
MSEENKTQINTEDEVITNEENNLESKMTFKDTFVSNLVDILVTLGLSIVALFIIDGILRVTAGYYVTEKVQMTAIIYLIISLIYTSVMQIKSCDTIGMRVSKLKINKAE